MNNQASKDSNCGGCSGMMWWVTLVVAVLAVPSFGVIIASIIPATGIFQVGLFVFACWVCTYLGMRLMSNPKMARKLDGK